MWSRKKEGHIGSIPIVHAGPSQAIDEGKEGRGSGGAASFQAKHKRIHTADPLGGDEQEEH